jgi:hypothetical protein
MKILFKALLAGALLLSLAACDNKGGEKKNSDVVAQPPPPPATASNYPLMDHGCIAGQLNCNQGLYSNYYQYGFRPYGVNPYNYNNGYAGYWGGRRNPYFNQYRSLGYNMNNLGFCNCPVGFRPVYNGGMGLGCVALNYIEPMASGAYYYGLQVQANNYHWVNIGQISNTNGYPTRNTCYDNVAQSCFVDQANSCGSSAFVCRPTAGGSRLGICTRQ